jgi:GNAT superfamily N-acetyltransferase
MIHIRPALPADADALTRIAISAKRHWNYPERWMEIWTPQLTFTSEYFQANESWVAELENSPVAFYTIQEKDGSTWLENMWVLPEYIGKGIGKELFLHAVSRSRLMGHLVLKLEADPNALGFYEKMGMRKIGETSYPFEDQKRILPLMEMTL